MGIVQLSDGVINQIAAGEVVERPSSVVKELVENAIDAGSTRIEVEATEGGKRLIRVHDNGVGIPADEAPLAFARHATSKIIDAGDLRNVQTLGFRGEALASIASVAEVEMRTRVDGSPAGTLVMVRGGTTEAVKPTGTPEGTLVSVHNLFYNTPARLKFLKTATTEKRYIADLVANLALAHPEITLSLILDGRNMFTTPGSGDPLETIAAVHGTEVSRSLIEVSWKSPFLEIQGYVSVPKLTRGNRAMETVFVNGRWVQNRMLQAAIEKGYGTLLPSRRFPVAVMRAAIDPSLIDVNVHPAKTEIRFKEERETFKGIYLSVKDGLLSSDLIPDVGGPQLPASSTSPAARRETQPYHQGSFHREDPPRAVWSSQVAEGNGGEAISPRPTVSAAKPAAPETVPPASARSAEPRHWKDPLWKEGSQPLPGPRPSSDRARREMAELTILGQVDQTFMIASVPGALWLIDQHVAHERILFEQVLAALRTGPIVSQNLLMPVQVSLTPGQAASLTDGGGELERLGFQLEPFGGQTFLLRSIPVALRRAGNKQGLEQAVRDLADLMDEGRDDTERRIAAMVACKGAVKAGQRLERQEMEKLVRDLARTETPFTCPHGRPIIVEIGVDQLKRWFYRH